MIRKSILLIPILLILSACGDVEDPNENPGNKDALKEIRKEDKVIEAFLNDANILYVSVEDNGSVRNGYAQYLCQILHEHQASCTHVKVVKVGSENDPNADNAFGVLLGESDCEW